MNDNPAHLSRRHALKALGAVPILVAALAGSRQIAEAKSAQKAVKYQSKPKGKQECDDCRFFIAGKTPMATGSCQLVEGKISPHGWCILFSPKKT